MKPKVVVLLQNHRPQDMKLILFVLRANRVSFSIFRSTWACRDYLENEKEEGGHPHLLLTDTEEMEFLKLLPGKFPFCMNIVVIGKDLQNIFIEEAIFNSINCFIARNDPDNAYFPHQIMGCIKRLINRNFFGVTNFLHGSHTLNTRIIKDTLEYKKTVTEISNYVEDICENTSIGIQVEGICDELIMNALYDANPKYEERDRELGVTLEENEKIVVDYGCDGRMLAVSVTDPFGRLGKETIFHYLHRCFFEDEINQLVHWDGQGAGLGFYRILNAVNSLVINVVPEKKTEIIGILDISLSRRAFHKVKKSFYYLRL